MKYWLVIGFKDEKFLESIKKHILSFAGNLNIEILLVEQGCSINWDGTFKIQSESGIVSFLNKALDFLKQKAGPDDWFVRIDNDDYYGPQYLLNIDNIRKSGAIATGIKDIYVKTESNSLIFCEGLNDANLGVPGGTLAGNIHAAVFFRSNKKWGEDRNWCIDMKSQGINVVNRSYIDFTLNRYKNHTHTFPVSGLDLPLIWLCNAYNQGEWSKEAVSKFANFYDQIEFDVIRSFNVSENLERNYCECK